jgi:hypothetical protein
MAKTKEKTQREKYIKAVSNDMMMDKFATEIGQKAIVQREDLRNPGLDQLKEVLIEIGKNMTEVGAIPKGMEYVGSAAVHIYKAQFVGEVAYLNQLALNSTPEALAGPAVSDLRGSMMEFYGRARQKKRSGF